MRPAILHPNRSRRRLRSLLLALTHVSLGLAGCLSVSLVRGDGGPAPQITRVKLTPDGSLGLEWSGASNNVVVQLSPSLTAPDWQAIPGVNWPINGTNWSGVVPPARRQEFVRLLAINPGSAPLPSQTYSLDLIGIHDSGSSNYNANCVYCHGDRCQDVALDGHTPAAHSAMVDIFRCGNGACVNCHTPGPDFLTFSAGALRKQVDMTPCFTCHKKDSLIGPAFYDK